MTACTRSQATIPELRRSSLHRCLERHGISRLPEVKGNKPAKEKFNSYPIGFFHVDSAELRSAQGKLYLFVAIDRTSKFAFVQLLEWADMAAASEFLEALPSWLLLLWNLQPLTMSDLLHPVLPACRLSA